MRIGGTSAAAPAFAGLIALLNDARLAARKCSLGFLNPLIYALKGDGFHDIVVGNAPGCGTPGFNVSVLIVCSFGSWVKCGLLLIGNGRVGSCYGLWDA